MRTAVMKKRIILKPSAIRAQFPPGGGFLPRIETYCDGALCSVVHSDELFASPALAVIFAETRALGIIDELLHHYGDVFTFQVCHSVPNMPSAVALHDDRVQHLPPASLFTAEPPTVPGFLIREYRRRNPRAFH